MRGIDKKHQIKWSQKHTNFDKKVPCKSVDIAKIAWFNEHKDIRPQQIYHKRNLRTISTLIFSAALFMSANSSAFLILVLKI